MDFRSEIIELISMKCEGEYWDFKEYHHNNKASLLHDIICMANNRVDRDAYIIFGVRDSDYAIVGVENDSHRRNQQQMIQQLKDKKFAGGIKPSIYLKTLEIENHEIDVLIIKNTNNTPYYLVESYKDREKVVMAQYIYTRIGDTNTDINKGADINHIEYLWKKRFMLDKSPLERIYIKLDNKEEWVNFKDGYYNKYNPDYTITLTYDEMFSERPDFYSYVMCNESTYYGVIKIKSYDTELYTAQYVVLDSGRYLTTVPSLGKLRFNESLLDDIYYYRYFTRDKMEYKLNLFLFDKENEEEKWAFNRFKEVILWFDDDCEKEEFIKYVYSNQEVFNRYLNLEKDTYRYIQGITELDTKEIRKKLRVGKVLNKMYCDFKIHNK